MKDAEPQPLASFYKELIAGGVAGACGKTSVAPLERTKILIQTGKAPSARVDHVLRFIYKSDGVLGFFRGNGASVARIVPYAAIHYATYERFRAAIVPEARRLLPLQAGLHGRPPVWVDLLAGSCSGATAVTLTYPLDLVRTRMAYTTEAAGGATIARTLTTIAAKEGVRGLYRGVTPTLAGILPYSGLKFYTYQKLKRMWSNAAQSASSTQAAQRSAAQQNDAPAAGMGASGVAAAVPAQQEAHPPVHLTLVFGACAGLVGQSLTYPLDIVRRRMQVASDVQHGVGAMWRHAREIVAQHGYRGMFRGLSINWIKAAPSTAVGFTVYDYAKHMLKLENHL